MESGHLQFELPPELWQLILSYIIDNMSLLNSILISKIHYQLLNDEQEWKRRCDTRPLAKLFVKSPERLWKEFYYQPSLPLFPVYDIVIAKTDVVEKFYPLGMANVSSGYQFSMNGLSVISAKTAQQDPSGKKLVRMITCRRPNQLPKHWLELGISWDKSFEDYKALTWKYNKNYQITTLPARNAEFIGVIQSIAKHEDIYYSIEFGFKGSLNELSIVAVPNLQYHYEYLYENKVIEVN